MSGHASPAPDPALSFGSVADAYERGRPSYPREAARWLTADPADPADPAAEAEPLDVLELGAGTGKLTRQLVELGHRVVATDPDLAMLDVLSRQLPDLETGVGTAERIPAEDASVDVVVCAQAFHWFDHDVALPEIARVLRPGGRLSLVWNIRDERIPWVRRLGELIGARENERADDQAGPLGESSLFGEMQTAAYRFRQGIDQHSILDLAASRSAIATLDDKARAERLAQVRAFYDDYGRGMDGMLLPYTSHCYRAQVVARPVRAQPTSGPTSGPVAAPIDPGGVRSPAGRTYSGEALGFTTRYVGEDTVPIGAIFDGPDTGMLLIDLR